MNTSRPVRTLPDLLRPGLDLVFVGINPGERSAQVGHYYAHPGNGFWPALSASPLVQLSPTLPTVAGWPATFEDDRRLLALGIGFTDVVKRVVTDSSTLSDAELRASLPAFRRRIAYARPRAVCFTTTRGFGALFPRTRTAKTWGRQPVSLEGAEVWVMPSTSGRAAGYRSEVHRVLADLAASLRRARLDADAARPETAA
jgi:TDG/mug DNA glycosylase family protein